MGFPMTVERVINRNRLDRTNHILMDDLRRLAEDSVTLAKNSAPASEGLRAIFGFLIALFAGIIPMILN